MYAAVNGLAEFGGGALLALGLLTPLGAAAVAGVMLVAIATVHWKNGFFNSNGGYEFNLLIVATAIALAFTGPGTISIDDLAGWTLVRTRMGPRGSRCRPWSPRDPFSRCASLGPSRHKTRRLVRRPPLPKYIPMRGLRIEFHPRWTHDRCVKKGRGRDEKHERTGFGAMDKFNIGFQLGRFLLRHLNFFHDHGATGNRRDHLLRFDAVFLD